MAVVITSEDIDLFLKSANNAEARTRLGVTAGGGGSIGDLAPTLDAVPMANGTIWEPLTPEQLKSRLDLSNVLSFVGPNENEGSLSLNNFTSSAHVGDGTTTAFTLSFAPRTEIAQAFVVGIDGVLQSPIDAYTVSRTTGLITFSSAPPVNSKIVVTTSAAVTGYDISDTTVTATGSTTTRKLTDRFADTVNVKDFGAVGDGVTDDTAAIDSALAAATAAFAPLYFPHGTYVRNSTLVLPSGAIILGDGSPKLGITLTDEKDKLRVGQKGTINGSSILFKDTGTINNYTLTTRDDDLSSVNPMVVTEQGIKTVVRGLAFIQDMNVRDSNGDYNLPAASAAANGYDVGHYIDDAAQGEYDDVVIWGYFTKAGRVLYSRSGFDDPDYNTFTGGSTMGRYGFAIVGSNTAPTNYGLSGTRCTNHSMFALDHYSRAIMTEAERITYYSTADTWRCLYIDGDADASTAEINGQYFYGSTIRCKHNYPIELDHCSNVEFFGNVIEVSPYGSPIPNSDVPEIIGSVNIKKSVGFFGCRINYTSLIFKSFAGSLAAGINIIGHGDPLQDSWVAVSDPNVVDGYAVMRLGTDANVGDIGFQLTKDISGEGTDWRVGMDISGSDNLQFKYDNVIVATLTNGGLFAPASYGQMVSSIGELTIATGAITVGFRSHYTVATEGGASTDDLLNINGGVDGMRIVLQAASGANTVVLRDNVEGNIRLDSDTDKKSLDNGFDAIELVYRAGIWSQLSFSNNG